MAQPTDVYRPTGDIEDKEVREFLTRFIDAYDGGDDSFFDYFAPDAGVFTVSSPTRIDGREEFRKGFAPHLKTKRVTQILAPRIETSGASASVMYHARIQIDGRTHETRCSLQLKRDERGGLSITQLHMSPQGSMRVVSQSFEDVVVLEERVATSLAQVGTPK
jgi:ketosteroid isomerase-like protein